MLDLKIRPVQYSNVDDIFIVWPEDISPLEELLAHFNSFSATTKFALEREKDSSIPFLGIKVTRKNGKVTTAEVYRKPTDTCLYLQYDSNNPKSVKNGIINTLLHRAHTLCASNSQLNAEIKKVESILIENKYPKKLIM
jgi:hypothetical protein